MIRRLVCLMMLCWLAMASAAPAQLAGGGAPNITPSLVAESERPAAGSTVELAFVMRPAAGWHGYWKNPGDAGIETMVEWTLPAGVTAGPLRYQVPHKLLIQGIMNYVYEGPYAQLVTVSVPAGLAAGTVLPIRAKLDWLECTDEVCVPASATLATSLTVGDGQMTAARRAAFDRYRAALPRPLGAEARFAKAGDRFRLAVPIPAAMAVDEAWFFPLTDGAIDYAAPQSASRAGDMLVIETKAGSGDPAKVEGVLRLGEGNGLALVASKGSVPAAGTPIANAEPAGDGSAGLGTMLAALGGAILGGLLLNVMPCVFPILSLKALSLARAGEDAAGARIEALAYAAGVILVCLALGGALLALRAGGSAAGWAFQLQDPRVILVLLLLVAAIALNLAGLFELPAITGGDALVAKGGTGGAFWTGALAAFVATPCTGPFMGAALGAALVLPTAAALAVFAGLGLGIALPFLALGFVPALRRRLPKPGPWMVRLRHILSVPMFVTALALAWILGRQAGVDGMTLGLASALLIALGLWWVGSRQQRGKPAAWWPAIPATALALAAVAIVPQDAAPAATEAKGGLAAEPFSEAKLAALRDVGTPVFVYFTADWCVTCKVNEAAAIDTVAVADAFAAKGVKVLVGDWTRGDPAITRFLAGQGRSGVPLYLFYRPGGAVEVLPQVLTPGRLTGLVA